MKHTETHLMNASTCSPETPEEKLSIRYIKDKNIVAARGRSTGLEVLPVYNKLIDQVTEHFNTSNKLSCYFHFTVINASTTKLLFNLLNQLARQTKKGSKITIYWVVDEGDEDLMDIGLDFKNELTLDFQITIK